MDILRPLMSELLRPQQLSDLTLPKRDITRLQRMVQKRTPMNLFFYGPPGLGKTSAARILIDAFGFTDPFGLGISDSITIIASQGLKQIEKWDWRTSVGVKICFIDEADGLSKSAQVNLRSVIENDTHCRFILAANDVRKIGVALRSRLQPISFEIAPGDREEVLRRLKDRYEKVLNDLGIAYDSMQLNKIVGIYFPVLRRIANEIQYQFN
jgi:replication factor C small subunit